MAVDPHTTFAALRDWQPATNVMSRDSALQFARSLHAGRLLSGSIISTFGQITISADLIEVSSRRVRGRASVTGEPDSLTVLLDRLAAQVIGAELGVSPPAAQ